MASSTCRVASMISGPMPSPRMTVIVWGIVWGPCGRDAGPVDAGRRRRKTAAYYAGCGPFAPTGRCSGHKPNRCRGTPDTTARAAIAAIAVAAHCIAARPLPHAIPDPMAGPGSALPGFAGQQRLELAGAVQRHHVVVAADVGVADEDLRHGGSPGQRHHFLALGRIGV